MKTHKKNGVDRQHSDDKLDSFLKQQIELISDLTKNDERITDDLETCSKWLSVFVRTTKDEKYARNCLVALMYWQLKKYGQLAEPFTDLNNCNKDLRQVQRNYKQKKAALLKKKQTSAEVTSPPELQVPQPSSAGPFSLAQLKNSDGTHVINITEKEQIVWKPMTEGQIKKLDKMEAVHDRQVWRDRLSKRTPSRPPPEISIQLPKKNMNPKQNQYQKKNKHLEEKSKTKQDVVQLYMKKDFESNSDDEDEDHQKHVKEKSVLINKKKKQEVLQGQKSSVPLSGASRDLIERERNRAQIEKSRKRKLKEREQRDQERERQKSIEESKKKVAKLRLDQVRLLQEQERLEKLMKVYERREQELNQEEMIKLKEDFFNRTQHQDIEKKRLLCEQELNHLHSKISNKTISPRTYEPKVVKTKLLQSEGQFKTNETEEHKDKMEMYIKNQQNKEESSKIPQKQATKIITKVVQMSTDKVDKEKQHFQEERLQRKAENMKAFKNVKDMIGTDFKGKENKEKESKKEQSKKINLFLEELESRKIEECKKLKKLQSLQQKSRNIEEFKKPKNQESEFRTKDIEEKVKEIPTVQTMVNEEKDPSKEQEKYQKIIKSMTKENIKEQDYDKNHKTLKNENKFEEYIRLYNREMEKSDKHLQLINEKAEKENKTKENERRLNELEKQMNQQNHWYKKATKYMKEIEETNIEEIEKSKKKQLSHEGKEKIREKLDDLLKTTLRLREEQTNQKSLPHENKDMIKTGTRKLVVTETQILHKGRREDNATRKIFKTLKIEKPVKTKNENEEGDKIVLPQKSEQNKTRNLTENKTQIINESTTPRYLNKKENQEKTENINELRNQQCETANTERGELMKPVAKESAKIEIDPRHKTRSIWTQCENKEIEELTKDKSEDAQGENINSLLETQQIPLVNQKENRKEIRSISQHYQICSEPDTHLSLLAMTAERERHSRECFHLHIEEQHKQLNEAQQRFHTVGKEKKQLAREIKERSETLRWLKKARQNSETNRFQMKTGEDQSFEQMPAGISDLNSLPEFINFAWRVQMSAEHNPSVKPSELNEKDSNIRVKSITPPPIQLKNKRQKSPLSKVEEITVTKAKPRIISNHKHDFETTPDFRMNFKTLQKPGSKAASDNNTNSISESEPVSKSSTSQHDSVHKIWTNAKFEAESDPKAESINKHSSMLESDKYLEKNLVRSKLQRKEPLDQEKEHSEKMEIHCQVRPNLPQPLTKTTRSGVHSSNEYFRTIPIPKKRQRWIRFMEPAPGYDIRSSSSRGHVYVRISSDEDYIEVRRANPKLNKDAAVGNSQNQQDKIEHIENKHEKKTKFSSDYTKSPKQRMHVKLMSSRYIQTSKIHLSTYRRKRKFPNVPTYQKDERHLFETLLKGTKKIYKTSMTVLQHLQINNDLLSRKLGEAHHWKPRSKQKQQSFLLKDLQLDMLCSASKILKALQDFEDWINYGKVPKEKNRKVKIYEPLLWLPCRIFGTLFEPLMRHVSGKEIEQLRDQISKLDRQLEIHISNRLYWVMDSNLGCHEVHTTD